MPSLFLATCEDWPALPENLKPLVNCLEQLGIVVKIAPWQSALNADLVWPICAWDYATHKEQFTQWLNQLEKEGISTVNPIALMRWNMHKTYLQDLSQSGVSVIPTQFFVQPDESQLRAWTRQDNYDLTISRLEKNTEEIKPSLLKEVAGSCFVLKPAVGQSGKAVIKWSVDEPMPDLAVYQQGLIIQPYIPAIEQYGETSMIFFNGQFSHAVKRQPPHGEWRANSAYGVQVFAIRPSQKALQAAQKVVDYLQTMVPSQKPPVYARIDGIDAIDDDKFILNECELIEPALYWHTTGIATEQFAIILSELLRQ